jgi:hypothetical protein
VVAVETHVVAKTARFDETEIAMELGAEELPQFDRTRVVEVDRLKGRRHRGGADSAGLPGKLARSKLRGRE